MLWLGFRGRGGVAGRPLWPVWLLAAATVFLVGFRIGLNVTQPSPNVIDVGYSGVIGAHRIVEGQSPYDHFPVAEEKLKACGEPNAEGDVRDRVQTNGRCESANERGDTYGPVAYLAYVPGYLLLGWDGKWDVLPAAHFTSIGFDLLALVLLGLVGLRYGGYRLGVTLAFAWAAYPFTQYVLSSNTNDAIPPALLLIGFLAARLGLGPRLVGRVGGPDEVRLAAGRAAVVELPTRARPALAGPLRRGIPDRDASPRSRSSCSSPT